MTNDTFNKDEENRDKQIISNAAWWKGRRGEWYVIVQVIFFGLVLFGPQTVEGFPAWRFPYSHLASGVGAVCLLIGCLLAVSGVFRLGTNLTAVPYPKEQATLVETGTYRLVRHPIYSGLIFMGFGWALWVHGWLTIVYAIILFVFFDIKSRREEQWLKEKFPDYAAYQKRVNKLIPFIY
ncbi:MAG: isoprenylcysteine carboxylmethyltransferase family protein [Chloroflexota bacterium]